MESTAKSGMDKVQILLCYENRSIPICKAIQWHSICSRLVTARYRSQQFGGFGESCSRRARLPLLM